MKRTPNSLAALGLPLLALSVCGASGTGSADDVARLTQLGCEMGQAYARRDLAALERINAEDYVQIDTRGIVVKQPEYAEYVRQRAAQFLKDGAASLSVTCDDIEVRLYGEAALVIGQWTYTTHRPAGDTSRRSRWTSMWTRSVAGWKRHAFQNTWVNPEANQLPPANKEVPGDIPDTPH